MDEHYTFDHNPRSDVEVLVSLDESSYEVGEHAMGDHPIVWQHDYEGGRAFYTALGHTRESYDDPFFRQHLAEAIAWAGETSKRAPPEDESLVCFALRVRHSALQIRRRTGLGGGWRARPSSPSDDLKERRDRWCLPEVRRRPAAA